MVNGRSPTTTQMGLLIARTLDTPAVPRRPRADTRPGNMSEDRPIVTLARIIVGLAVPVPGDGLPKKS